MAYAEAGSIVRQIESLFEGGSVAGLTDRQLLDRFTAHRNAAGDAAFGAIVTRHGPMVLRICRQFLRDRHDAEDAFQAVFLVLARKARSIRDPDLLGTWLYGVAIRTARKAGAKLDRRRRQEESETMGRPVSASRHVVEPTIPSVEALAIAREQAQMLHDEIARLPHPFRLPVILCYFEGLTLDQAAGRLRCPAGTLRSRLARAREKLRRALDRRGVDPSTNALAVVMSPRSASESVSPQLCEITTRAAVRFAIGETVASTATTLAREVVRAITIQKLRTAFVILVFLAALTGGGGYLARSIALGDEPGKAPADVQSPARARVGDAAAAPTPGKMFVVGRVVDPQGKPVPDAQVGVSLRRKLLFAVRGSEEGLPASVGNGASDSSGGFRLETARASSSRHAQVDATAWAPGYGVGWAHLDPDEDRPAAEIRLVPEQVIEGRLFDVQGQAVGGVVVSVSGILRDLPPATVVQSRAIEPDSDGTYRWWGRVHDGPGWPKPATTDATGRFTLRGIGRGLHARLSVLDPRFAPQTIEIATDATAGVKDLKAVLLPARTITGRVTYADTGRPVAHAAVHVTGSGGEGGIRYLADRTAETDADGRFRLSPLPGDQVNVWAAAPDGQPYSNASASLAWPKGATGQVVDLALPRGVLIRGKVTEEDTGQPIADVVVSFKPNAQRGARSEGAAWARTKADGSFAFGVGPRPGHLSVQAPGEDYQLQAIGGARLGEGREGGERHYAHAFLPCDPRTDTEPTEIRVSLRRGASVKVRLVGPDDQLVRDVRVYSRAALGPMAVSATRMFRGASAEVARHGHFEVHGLDAETEVPVYFLQPERKLGATIRLSGKMAKQEPLTVRLEPCGLARLRPVGANGKPIGVEGKPVTGQPRRMSITMVATPGPPLGSAAVRAGALAADEDFLGRVDPVNHGNGWVADAQGRITLPALIPGATYRIIVRGGGDEPGVRELVVGTGETLELGDVRVSRLPN